MKNLSCGMVKYIDKFNDKLNTISSKEALKDVEIINWSDEILSGDKKVIIEKSELNEKILGGTLMKNNKSIPTQIIDYFYENSDNKSHIPYKILVEMQYSNENIDKHPSSIEFYRKSEGLTHDNFKNLKCQNDYLERELNRLRKDNGKYNDIHKEIAQYKDIIKNQELEIIKLKAILYDLQNK